MKNDIVAIKHLANIKIEAILFALGVEYRERYYYLNAPCPVHKGDRRDAWSWHLERGIWKCFSHACDSEHGSDIYGLIQGIRGCSFGEAVKFITNTINCNLSKEEIQKLKDDKANKDFIISSRKKKKAARIYPESSLQKLEPHAYLESRGFSRQVLDAYQIGACLASNKYFSNRIVIPIRNKDGYIVGFTGRTLDKDWQSKGIPKWKHSKDYIAGDNLFNIDCAKKYIKESGIAILVEGPLDVLRLEEAGIHNSVALLGKTLHPGQMTLLMSVSAFKLLIAFDNDAPGRQGAESAAKKGRSLFDVDIIEFPEEYNDIGELPLNIVEEVFA